MKARNAFAAIACAGVFVLSAASAQAQKEAKPAHGMSHMRKMDKDADKSADKSAKDAAKAERKAAERAEHVAKDEIKDQPKAMLKGIKLTKDEKAQRKAIEKKYAGELKALDKQEDAARKGGTPMSDVAQKIAALHDQERAELRATLTPAQQAQFDANVSKGEKH